MAGAEIEKTGPFVVTTDEINNWSSHMQELFIDKGRQPWIILYDFPNAGRNRAFVAVPCGFDITLINDSRRAALSPDEKVFTFKNEKGEILDQVNPFIISNLKHLKALIKTGLVEYDFNSLAQK